MSEPPECGSDETSARRHHTRSRHHRQSADVFYEEREDGASNRRAKRVKLLIRGPAIALICCAFSRLDLSSDAGGRQCKILIRKAPAELPSGEVSA